MLEAISPTVLALDSTMARISGGMRMSASASMSALVTARPLPWASGVAETDADGVCASSSGVVQASSAAQARPRNAEERGKVSVMGTNKNRK
jgi:hypothetical protein